MGVGKSTTSLILQKRINDSTIINIGNISCKIASDSFSADSIETLQKEKLDYCQNKTADHTLYLISKEMTKYCFLEGHFVLGGLTRDDYRMPEFFFKKINLKLIILLIANEKTIKKRVSQNIQKKRPNLILDSLEYYLDLEKKHAYYIANLLNINIVEIENNYSSEMHLMKNIEKIFDLL